MPLPPVDEHLVKPEVTRDEVVRGRRVVALPALPPHADLHHTIDRVVGTHLCPGYVGSVDLLTRLTAGSDFATDTSVRKAGIDPATGDRHLEEIAFEVVHEQSLREVTERGEDLCARGVRRFFAVLVKKGEIRELHAGRWTTLERNDAIEDPCFVRPIAVGELLEAAQADDAVARALIAKKNPVIEELRANERANLLLKVLAARGIAVPAPLRERVLATDAATLDGWIDRAITADALADVLDSGG
ncbi:hypothetical protein [Polyangium aurulentum]|uniref:hypothetical protein n=1 Tax=Polyangium aurulentum TaxID=2567896 RepID=UPI0010ADF78C|nr:hypothetical protein [Polyangium aurulentum]UQA57601.1 hypothetical protein E8A73_041030 [Polyangium aurulentum]